MDFGNILDEWENSKKPARVKKDMNQYLDGYLPDEKTAAAKEEPGERLSKAEKRAKLQRMKPQAEIDLHGLKVKEALELLEKFLRDSLRKGLKKVLIIHGKGNHSTGSPVLGKEVRKFLERCAFAGEIHPAPREMGGNGAVWVILRS
jgi:DNA-nicking Smr family endonuclease